MTNNHYMKLLFSKTITLEKNYKKNLNNKNLNNKM